MRPQEFAEQVIANIEQGGESPTHFLLSAWRYDIKSDADRQRWLEMFGRLELLDRHVLYEEVRQQRGTWCNVFGDSDGERGALLTLIREPVLRALQQLLREHG